MPRYFSVQHGYYDKPWFPRTKWWYYNQWKKGTYKTSLKPGYTREIVSAAVDELLNTRKINSLDPFIVPAPEDNIDVQKILDESQAYSEILKSTAYPSTTAISYGSWVKWLRDAPSSALKWARDHSKALWILIALGLYANGIADVGYSIAAFQ